MSSATHLAQLSEDQRRSLQQWLQNFEQTWAEPSLAEQALRLLASDPLRKPALIEMVKIDLRKRWDLGRVVPLEAYLKRYPELGDSGTVAADLVWAEYEARRSRGPVSLDDFRRRFPRQVEEILSAVPVAVAVPVTTPAGESGKETAPPQPASAQTLENPPALLDVSAAAPADLPAQFGRYRILKKLGQGGMGAVYLAHDSKLDRKVALKVPSLGGSPEVRERFYREARAASTLSHPNLCPVFDVDEVGGVHFLTMPYVEGRPLSDLVKGGGPLPQRQVAALVRKLALAMQEAHARGVIHRDLKPSNVMVTPSHEPVIMDFGLARREGATDPRLTSAGELLGTPAYMSPEQVEGDVGAMGPGCDVYSLGVVLYELLTGRLPFTGALGQVLSQVVSRQPDPPSRLRPDLDPALEAVCLKAMAKKVRDRYASMADFAAALGASLEGVPPPPSGEPVPPPLPVAPDAAAEAGGQTTRLMEELLARLDRPPRRAVPAWGWVAIAAAGLLLLGSVVYLAVIRGPTHVDNRVSVQLVGLHITNIHDTRVVYILNGQEVGPEALKGSVSVPVGENRLVVKRGDEVIEERTFQVTADDAEQEVKVPPEKTDERATVRLKGIRVDPGEGELTFFLGGQEVTAAELSRPRKLQRGMHELVVKRDGVEVRSVAFAVGLKDETVSVSLDLRRVKVTVKLVNVDLKGPALSATLNGRPIGVDELGKPLALLPGDYELVLARGGQETRDKFTVARGDDGKVKSLELAAPKPPDVAVGRALELSDAVKAILPLTADKDPKVRAEAADSLGVLNDRSAVPALCKLLSDDHHDVRKKAAEVLEKMADPVAVPALRGRVGDGKWYNPWRVGDEDPEAGGKAAALRGLRKLAPDQVTGALTVALASSEPHMRRWAARELAAQADRQKALPALRRLVGDTAWYRSSYRGFHDPEWGGKGDALKLLRQLDRPGSTAALARALKASHYEMRRWAAEELGRQKDRAALPALKEHVGAGAWYKREYSNIAPDPAGGGKAAALKALRELEFNEATEPLTRALFSKDPNERRWAADELAIQKDKAAIPALKRRLADDTWDERTSETPEGGGKVAALKALKALTTPEEVKAALVQALSSPNAKVRQWAVRQVATEGQK